MPVIDWFKMNMPTFSTPALIFEYRKMGTQIYQPFFQ